MSSASSLQLEAPIMVPPRVVPVAGKPINHHSMQTRAKSGFSQPRLEPRLLLAASEPKTTKQALAHPDWLAAMKVEYNTLINNKAWTLVPLPPHRQAIGSKWVFRVKENPNDTINKYKARLVASGFHKREGFDFNETFSPVVKFITIRIILSIALTYRWFIQ